MAGLVLAGDVGGTKTNLALYRLEEGGLDQLAEESYPSQEFPGPGPIINRFLTDRAERPQAACLGIAGPFKGGRWQPPNLPWSFTADELAGETGLGRIVLLNDLEAMAHAVPHLGERSLRQLNPGVTGRPGNAVLIAAGTGLGQSILFWDGRAFRPSATEGGHTEFAPADETEIDLLRYLWPEHDHVSWERLVSGPGLVTIFRFLVDTGREREEAWLTEQLAEGDPAAVIAQTGLDKASPACRAALDLFVHLYGRAAGNLALKGMAVAGIYIGGGIAPKILPALESGAFLAALQAKGRMSDLMAEMPVRVILDQQAPLLGAAGRAAAELAG